MAMSDKDREDRLKEVNAFSSALCDWLNSQDVKTSEALPAMTSMVGVALAATAGNLEALIEGVSHAQALILATAIQGYIERMKLDFPSKPKG